MKTFTSKHLLIGFLSAPFFLVPLFALGQTTSPSFASDGILSCNQVGANSMSVGRISAASGIFVPVSDAAVTLNTGFLVYKECVLRTIVDAEAHSATSALIKKLLNDYMTGNNGNPLFSQDIQAEQVSTGDDSVTKTLSSSDLDTLDPAFRASVIRAIGVSYALNTRQPADALKCPYTGNLGNALNGTELSWDSIWAQRNPACNPMFAYEMANSQVTGRANAKVDNMMTRLNWGQGTLDMQTTDANGNTVTVTPASIVNALTQQAVTSGFRQTENANDIGQMVSSLFASMGSQIIGSSSGLSGLTQNTNGQGSYLDQLAKQSATNLVGTVVNAALSTLNGALSIEENYNSVITSIENTLIQTINSLRGTENTCWNLIESKVCTTDSSGNPVITYTSGAPTCTTSDGSTLHIATSTAFSQAAIAQIGVDPKAISTSLTNSNTIITTLNRLINSVSNTTSQDVQSAALYQLDTLVADKNNPLHSQTDVTNAQSQLTAVQQTTSNLLTNTALAWGGDPSSGTVSTYPTGTAWCNYNDPGLVAYWKAQWK